MPMVVSLLAPTVSPLLSVRIIYRGAVALNLSICDVHSKFKVPEYFGYFFPQSWKVDEVNEYRTSRQIWQRQNEISNKHRPRS